jgi:hypothetical protein
MDPEPWRRKITAVRQSDVFRNVQEKVNVGWSGSGFLFVVGRIGPIQNVSWEPQPRCLYLCCSLLVL